LGRFIILYVKKCDIICFQHDDTTKSNSDRDASGRPAGVRGDKKNTRV